MEIKMNEEVSIDGMLILCAVYILSEGVVGLEVPKYKISDYLDETAAKHQQNKEEMLKDLKLQVKTMNRQ